MPSGEESNGISEKMKDVIRLLLTPNPEKRPTSGDIEKLLIDYDNLS